MLLVPHIRCFGLVFIAVLISVVHTVPTSPRGSTSSAPLDHGHDIAAHSDDTTHTGTSHPILDWNTYFRVTVFGDDMSSKQFPLIGPNDRTQLGKAIGAALDLSHMSFRYTNGLDNQDGLLKKMVFFLVEAREGPFCHGDPCFGYRSTYYPKGNKKAQIFCSMYQLKADEKDIKELTKYTKPQTESTKESRDAGAEYEKTFLELLRKKLEDSESKPELEWWADLKKEIERQDKDQQLLKGGRKTSSRAKSRKQRQRGAQVPLEVLEVEQRPLPPFASPARGPPSALEPSAFALGPPSVLGPPSGRPSASQKMDVDFITGKKS